MPFVVPPELPESPAALIDAPTRPPDAPAKLINDPSVVVPPVDPAFPICEEVVVAAAALENVRAAPPAPPTPTATEILGISPMYIFL
jgi:hypothetical protein